MSKVVVLLRGMVRDGRRWVGIDKSHTVHQCLLAVSLLLGTVLGEMFGGRLGRTCRVLPCRRDRARVLGEGQWVIGMNHEVQRYHKEMPCLKSRGNGEGGVWSLGVLLEGVFGLGGNPPSGCISLHTHQSRQRMVCGMSVEYGGLILLGRDLSNSNNNTLHKHYPPLLPHRTAPTRTTQTHNSNHHYHNHKHIHRHTIPPKSSHTQPHLATLHTSSHPLRATPPILHTRPLLQFLGGSRLRRTHMSINSLLGNRFCHLLECRHSLFSTSQALSNSSNRVSLLQHHLTRKHKYKCQYRCAQRCRFQSPENRAKACPQRQVPALR